ncbi:sugar ABC transporter substrate-binding protein [Leucobacter sp. CSA1]|uniref:Sugar ABC transporter substrate-binding protein n=1 Tax=Leucobacter chromiisoli TaxID=2796471 RepID=A0A934Q4W9_9MICO|nr:sugar ABC transporter substrate-binding protein [Leucobacter chromiisoli]MBK0418409.1 sugar ABC transporter substrate-binding protein [Leucobacter chromiisoli]
MQRRGVKRTLLPLALLAGLGLSACTTGAAAGGGDAPADGELSLAGKTIGVAVVSTQTFWDREAFQGAVDEVERLGGVVVPTDGNRDNTLHAENHDIFLSQQVDAVITILGDDSVEPKLEAISEAGIPVFGVDRASEHVVNNAQSNSTEAGEAIASIMGEQLGGEGKVAVFNAFSETLTFCGERYNSWKDKMTADYPDVELLTPELAEEFANAPEDARQQTLTLLERYPEGELDAIHVACWDQPAIGVVQALEEAGRTEVKVTAIDAGPDTLEIMMEPDSPFVGNVAQQPREIGKVSADNVAKHLAGEDVEAESFVETYPVDGAAGAEEVYAKLGYDKQ